jgi:hypothetical protein
MYEYWKEVHDTIIEWYKSADSKAQAIITVNGMLLSFVGLGVILGFDPGEISTEVRIIFYAITLLFVCTITSSVACAVLGVARGFEKPLEDTEGKVLTHPIDIAYFVNSAHECFKRKNKNQEEQALLKRQAEIFFDEQIKKYTKEEDRLCNLEKDRLCNLAVNITRLSYYLHRKMNLLESHIISLFYLLDFWELLYYCYSLDRIIINPT